MAVSPAAARRPGDRTRRTARLVCRHLRLCRRTVAPGSFGRPAAPCVPYAEGPAGACVGGALGVVGVVQQAPWSFQTPQSPVLPGVSFWVHHWALYVRPLWETSSPAL